MEPKENQRVLLTKRLLHEGMLRLLKTKNLQKINVTELCRESGINRATFYKHYSCPHDVLAEIAHNFIHHFLDMQNIKSINDLQITEKYLEDTCIYLYENADLVKTLIQCNMDREISDIFINISQKQSRLREHLEKRFDEDSVRLLSTFICHGGYSMICRWLMEDIPKSPKEIAFLIYDMATRGWVPTISGE